MTLAEIKRAVEAAVPSKEERMRRVKARKGARFAVR